MNFNFNLKEFLKYLVRFKWLLIIVPLVCVIITYFFVKQMPREYRSEALISTGLTSSLQDAALKVEQNTDYFKLTQQFGNLLELMRSKKELQRFPTN
ncbi:Wzz/FepE/Etk N-terminal domain-containing protein [Niabella hibiscisoli]|uniref:Wzz/FepE/Etk N-terminal domain-containing protein n=1 Tax=Niabella hibiscisoli TaxID=1825928 RepID=UPI00374D2076